MIADEPQAAARLETLHTRLTSTQALPQTRNLTEADIAAEVAAARTGRLRVVIDTNVLVLAHVD